MKTPLLTFPRVAVLATLLATPWLVSSQTPSGGTAPSGGTTPSGGGSSGTGQSGATGGTNTQRPGSQGPSQQRPPGGGSQIPNRPGDNGIQTTNPSATPTGGQNSSSPNTGMQSPNGQNPSGSQPPIQNPNNNGSTSATGTTSNRPNNPTAAPAQQQGANGSMGTQAGSSVGATGTIDVFDTNGFSLAGGSTGAASNFLFGPGTVFTDSAGRTIPRERITKQTPVTVYYEQHGNNMVATRVVTNHTTTSTFSAGTIREVSPGVLVIEQPGASSTPARYVNDQTTNYVDQNGQPVNPQSVGPGTPVRVYYTKVGDTLVASRVEVQQGHDSGLPKPPVESKAGTTTVPEPQR